MDISRKITTHRLLRRKVLEMRKRVEIAYGMKYECDFFLDWCWVRKDRWDLKGSSGREDMELRRNGG